MSTKFNMTRDINGYNGFGIIPTTDVYTGLMEVGVAQTVTVPDNYPNWIAIFSYTPGSSMWVSFDGVTAVAPTGAFSASSSVLNPSARSVKAGQTISVITADDTNPLMSIEFQVIQPFSN